jgi:RNA polymerase sporulation-specific sigma factor
MSNVTTFPHPLKHEEVLALFIAYQEHGDLEARATIIETNTRLAAHCAYSFHNTGIDYEDLMGVAMIGLMKATDSFKLDKKIKFATYAARCMNNEILMLMRQNKKHQFVFYLDEPTTNDGEGGEQTLKDKIPDDSIEEFSEAVMEDELARNVREIVSTLPLVEQQVLDMRFFKEMTQKEVSKVLNFSQSYITRLEAKALKSIRRITEQRETAFEKDLADKIRGDVMEVAGKGNRQEAILLLQNTRISYAQIAKQTGVPSGTVGTMAQKYRPLEVRQSIALEQSETRRKEKEEEVTVTKSTPVSFGARKGVAETKDSDVREQLTKRALTARTDEEVAQVNKELGEWFDSATPETIEDIPEVPSKSIPLGDAIEQFRQDIIKEVEDEVAATVEPISEPDQPKVTGITRRVTFNYQSEGGPVSTADFIEEMEDLIETLKESGNQTVSFNVSLSAS